MRRALLLVFYFALPLSLALFGVYSAIAGEWSSAGIMALFALLLAGAKVLE